MTREEAERECRWAAVRVSTPRLARRTGPLRAEAKPPPPRPDPAQDVPQEPRTEWGGV